MVHLSEDIHSMTDFKRRTSDFVARLKETGRPLVLTTNGRAEVVVQDAAAYQKLLDAAHSWEAHEALQRELVSTRRLARGHGAK
ncbi:MAG TPA: type II toxin-antitoxin system Phd/YefM family antitoxin [Bryobacteraceae bacterium]|nr:type II toxin-antitoxin system Phd/YefM family antitoxin [Bryobacteraceae bacterium]